MLEMARHMLQNEGVGGFFKGLTPALLRQGVYSSIRVGIYEPIRDFYVGGSAHPTYAQRVLSGGTAGAIGILLANPTELIKVRMQADRTGTRYSGVADAFRTIVKTEGRSHCELGFCYRRLPTTTV
jgi:solute carrier family 25 uncoupling protein 8/9